jgi:Alcohol dehydrogenase GroES-like domain
MSSETRGVVSMAKGAPVTLETIVVPDPGPGEAVVGIKACGVCHTDLHYREGGINDDFPFPSSLAGTSPRHRHDRRRRSFAAALGRDALQDRLEKPSDLVPDCGLRLGFAVVGPGCNGEPLELLEILGSRPHLLPH